MRGGQLGLLLWKNYVIRKRKPGMLALVLIWPVLVFLILYAVRDNTDPTYNPTCQFPARLMPQNDFLPFLQNFVCSLGNPCEPLSEYEEIPSYQSSKLGPLLQALQPLMKNETILNVAKALPKSIQFLRSMAEVLTQPGVKKIFERGIHLGDVFKDHDEIREFFKREVPEFSPAVVNNFLNVSIKLQYLVEAFGSSNMDGIICKPEGLKQFLVLPTEEDLLTVSKALCALNSTLIPDLLQNLVEQLNFNGLFSMINLVTAKFSSYDIFTDLQQTADSILSLRMVDLYVPQNLRLQKWFPKIIPLFKNVTFKDIDLLFIDKAVDLLDPIFREERDWAVARKGFLKLNSVLKMVKDLIHNKPGEKLPPNSVFEMTNTLTKNLIISFHSNQAENIAEIMDNVWEVLEGGAKLTKVLLYDYESDIEVSSEVLDSLRTFFPKKILNTLSYLISITKVIVQALHHVATLHFESSRRVWNVTQNHASLVRPLLALSPSVYQTIVESFSRLDLVEKFINVNKNAGDVFCSETMFKDIFNNFEDPKTDPVTISTLICSDEGKQFITEIYDSFNMNNFERLVRDMLATLVYGVMGNPMPMSISNITTVVRSIKQFSAYLETPKPTMEPDWEMFAPNIAWSDTFKDTSAQGRLDILGIHLSIAKKVGLASLSYIKIKPSLQKLDFAAHTIVDDIQRESIDWKKEVNDNVQQLIDTFYLTVADRPKVLKILEIENFTQTLCEVSDPPQLVNYPAGSNATHLKHDICRISKYVEGKLHLKLENSSSPPVMILDSGPFNWTAFNQRVIRIYSHIDEVIHTKYPDYNIEMRQNLMDQFAFSWTKNLTVRDGWEVSVGLMCKLGETIESLTEKYGIEPNESWKTIRSWARALSDAFRALQDRVAIVMDENRTSTIVLNLMPQTGILEEVILRNIQDFLNDTGDLITLKLPDISAIIEYKNRETDWPCLKVQSIGEVLGIRNGTRKIVREIERIACNPGSFVNEWKQLFSDAINGSHSSEKPFDWTEGYKKFRYLIANLTELNPESNILSETPKVSLTDIRSAFENVQKFIDSKFTDKSVWNDILTSVDNKLDELMDRAKHSAQPTRYSQASYYYENMQATLRTSKHLSYVIHEMATVGLNILDKRPEIDAFSILGFDDKSPVKIAYSHLVDLAATLINGLSSSSIMQKISLALQNPHDGPTCEDIFSWFAEFRQGISVEDYRKLKNSTCDSDPTNFNVFTDLITKADAVRTQPVKAYPLFATRTIFKLYELGAAVKSAFNDGLKVNLPFTAEYWNTVFRNLSHQLKQNQAIRQVARLDSKEPFHIGVEFCAEVLRHLSLSLQKLVAEKAQEDIHLWDLVEDGDVRQLLKLLEAHPSESISLAASLAWVDSITGKPTPYNELKKKMCERHFDSQFWNETKRIHFLRTICSFDPVQLLKSLTSEEFHDLIRGLPSKIQRESSMSKYLADVIDAFYNLSISHPGIAFKTNLFNVSTWKNLDNVSWSMIYDTEQSWMYYHFDKLNPDKSSFTGISVEEYYWRQATARYLDTFDSVVQTIRLSIDLISGGDVWTKLRAIYEKKPQMNAALSIVEDLPNLIISTVNTFFNTEITNSSINALLTGKTPLCEVNMYLKEPKYFRRKGFLDSFSHSCRKLYDFEITQIFPYESIIASFVNGSMSSARYVERAMTHVKQVQSLIIRTSSEGFKDFQVPTYWVSFIAGNFRDFVEKYDSMDPHILVNSTAHQVSKLVESVMESIMIPGDCPWCSDATNFLQKFNGQLSKHETYLTLFCTLGKLDFTELQDILFRRSNWAMNIHTVPGVGDSNTTVFFMELEKSVQYLADLTYKFLTPNNSFTASCKNGQLNGIQPVKPSTYIGLLRIAFTVLHEHVRIFDTDSTHKKLVELGKMAEKSVPIWIPLRSTVKKSNIEEIDRLFRGVFINVNMLDTNTTLNEPEFYEILVSKRAKKLLQNVDIASNFPSISNVSRELVNSLDFDLIEQKLPTWRDEATTKLYWLKQILKNLEAIAFEAGNLLDVASTINFNDGLLNASNLLEKVVHLLREETIDKFFDGFNELLNDVEPFITDPVVKDDLRTALSTLESMEIFKNLGLLNTKYPISDMFPNWPVVRNYLINNVGLIENVTKALSAGKVDMLSVYTKERKAISFQETICSPKKLGEILEYKNDGTTITEISTSLCKLSSERAQNVTVKLIKKLKFGSLFKDIMSASVKNILSNANLNEKDGTEIINNLGFAAELVPLLKGAVTNVSDQFSADFLIANKTASPPSTAKKMDFRQFLSDTGQMLCGHPVVQDTGRFFKVITSIEENKEEFNAEELASLPTDFCRDTYKEISRIGAGKILWTYVKPLLRGRILYTPRTIVIDQVMNEANSTFVRMENFGVLINSFEKSMSSLANLTDLGKSLTDLKDILASDLMKIALKSFGGASLGTDLESFDLGKLAWRMKNSPKLLDTVKMLSNLMDCVLTDRVIGFSTEKELEEEASRLIRTNDFLAGVVFIDEVSRRSKRSYEQTLPDNITYKIRMDVDSVPSTSRLKNQFWTPGPDGSFVENLRYLRGFVQLQDSIDRALIKVKTQTNQEWKTVSQQMPYACWKFLSFQSALYESQGLQVCFFFALMMCVGAAVRHIVWERESQNAMVMSVMGLKPWRNTFAWFITSLIELSFVAICIHIILIAGQILPHSNPILVLILLLDYVFATVTFCYMVSTMFSSASLAAVTTVVMFLLTYMPYIIAIAMEARSNLAVKLLISLNMSTSFCYGCLYAVRKEVQGTGLTWGSIWEESSPGDSMSFGVVLVMIAIDGFLYAAIGYIITRYTNSGKGWHGLRSISLWWADSRAFYGRPSYLAFENQVYFTNEVVLPSSSTHQDSENDITSLNVNDEKQIGVRFDDVRKVYQTESGECVAVDDFSLKLIEGEVTTLLGRNGAGKTTIIKMLTGMVAPTSGEIWLPNNDTEKPNIGVCPQTNVLIGSLTPREHMTFYAKLKYKKGGYDMSRDIDTMLTSMELDGQEDELVSNLSGGTQRRLCVCLAFLGAPNLVILDEPGAGVDPAARRRIWRLIDKHRIGRTVLLSTHHLDEADMLSDTVVIMHKGKILSSGSPLTLKLNYGQGYRLAVSFPIQEHTGRIEKGDQDILETLEKLKNVIEDVVPNASISDANDTEVNIILPFQKERGVINDVAGAVKALEDNQEKLGFSHFNVECDTLERVFLDMCAHADGGEMYAKPASLESLNSVNSVGFAVPTDDVDLIAHEPTLQSSAFRQGKALLKKRLWHFSRDWQAPLAALILPTLFVAVAMGFSLIRPPSDDQPPLVLTPELYNMDPAYFYSIDSERDQFHSRVSLQLRDRFGNASAGYQQVSTNNTGTCDCVNGEQVCHELPPPVKGLIRTNPGRPTLDWIISTQQQYIEKRYGGWSLSHMASKDKTGVFVVWYNNKGHHSLPAYINSLNEAILRANGVLGHLTTINHPIKLSRDQLNRTSLLQHVADVGVALVLLIAFSLVGAQGAKELVRERLSEEKRILYLAGVRPLTYWTTALIWDLLVFAASILLAVIVFEIFGLPAYVARQNLSSVCLLLFLYAWAVIPFNHLAEKVFDDSSLSNMVLFCVNTFIGVSSLATILIIDILGKSETAANVRNFLHQLLLIFPQYALGDGLVQISKNDITANLLERFHMNTYKPPLSWELLGPHCLYLFTIGVILYVINLVIECRALPDLIKKKVSYPTIEEDEDVARERNRVEKGLSNDILKTIHIRKEYNGAYGKNVAVRDLSFGIQPGECFGLFGVNGAGKSTTFKILTTEIKPTAGRVVLNEIEVGSGPLCSGDVGYCPQSDSLDPFLTPHQSLTIHGEVSGIRNVSRAVELALKRLDLTKYAHQRVANLSGGNKRKLCAAISVMIPSRIVLMDEATSGMDPASKDLVVRAVKSIIKGRGSVLMTSHSVAECENLCTRVGVLARAGLKCIGSPQYLKHKYGEGYIVFLRFRSPTLLSDLLEATARHLPGASIASRQDLATRLLVPRNRNNKLSSVFAKVKDLADELDAAEYTLTQSSLDQVLVNFSEALDNDKNFENEKTNDSRSYLNTDAIHMNTMRSERFTSLPIS